MQDAKLKTLDSIIGMMDDRMLGAAKARKQAAAPAAPAAPAATSPADLAEATGTESETDSADADEAALRQLYESEGSDTPVDVNGRF